MVVANLLRPGGPWLPHVRGAPQGRGSFFSQQNHLLWQNTLPSLPRYWQERSSPLPASNIFPLNLNFHIKKPRKSVQSTEQKALPWACKLCRLGRRICWGILPRLRKDRCGRTLPCPRARTLYWNLSTLASGAEVATGSFPHRRTPKKRPAAILGTTLPRDRCTTRALPSCGERQPQLAKVLQYPYTPTKDCPNRAAVDPRTTREVWRHGAHRLSPV